jgi:hypothetical protein
MKINKQNLGAIYILVKHGLLPLSSIQGTRKNKDRLVLLLKPR